MAEINTNNLPGGDVPLSFDRLNKILKDSGLLPTISESDSSIEVVEKKVDQSTLVVDEDKPLFEVILNEPNVSFSDEVSNAQDKKVSKSVLDLFLSDEVANEKDSDYDKDLINDYETFLDKLDAIQLRKVVVSANSAEKEGIPFEDFYKNLVDEYNNTSN